MTPVRVRGSTSPARRGKEDNEAYRCAGSNVDEVSGRWAGGAGRPPARNCGPQLHGDRRKYSAWPAREGGRDHGHAVGEQRAGCGGDRDGPRSLRGTRLQQVSRSKLGGGAPSLRPQSRVRTSNTSFEHEIVTDPRLLVDGSRAG